MTRRILLAAGFILAAGARVAASDVNESELFSTPVLSTRAAVDASAAEEKTSVKFSGAVTSVVEVYGVRGSTDSAHHSYLVGNAFMDARMKNDMKAFADVETMIDPQASSTTYNVRELFFDFNLDRRVYVRTGKQVLQWGRCTLWNPTDLVNVEKQPFIRKIGTREGAYGLKLHAPFGAQKNIYGFLDTGRAPTTDDLGGALKYEFLVGRTEMAFPGWAKKTYNPVAGYDFSTRIGDVDIVGEASVSKGDNVKKVVLENGVLDVQRDEKEWAPLAAVNMSKGFRLGNFNDRLRVAGEFFYNRPGYKKHFFDDSTVYPFRIPLVTHDASGTAVALPAGTKAGYLLGNNLYTMNYFSRYYGALFTSVGRFIVTDMTLNMNYIRNFDDGTGILSTGVTYTNLSDLTLGLLVNTFTGPRNGEYTYLKVTYDVQLTAGVSF